MLKITIVLLVVIAAVACAMFGLPAFSVIMACLACFMAGLTAAMIGVLVGTNVFKINYETAFTRSFWGGIALSAAIVVGWTAVLNLLAGGLTADLVSHLWQVSFDCAVASFAAALVTVASWGVLVFRRRK
ncbi:hypothetical protein BH10CYA1_BH10CYA1_45640 [soil metagenome]